MTVTREDVESYLTAIRTWKSLCVKYPATVPMNVELNVTTSLYTLNGIEQVLEDRLNQVDYKSLAEEQNKTLLLCKKDYEGIKRACKKYGFEKTFKDCGESIEYIDNIVSKYEAMRGDK